MDYTKILQEINEELTPYRSEGAIATYIPELAKVDAAKFGIHLSCLDGGEHTLGHSDEKFSIQSISKVPAVALAFSIQGEKIWERVGVEPSGDPFNSLVQLEHEHGIPRNPLINAGALVIADMLLSSLENPKNEYLSFLRKLAADESIDYNFRVAQSERQVGYRNAAMAYFLKAYDNIENDVEEVLDLYCLMCSVEMSCRQLAHAFLLFANWGKMPGSGEQILTVSQTKRLNALMQTCGFYDEAGEFTFKVGLPGKSGVGGGIVAVCPKYYAVAVWSPRLNSKGNSVLGMKALELLTTKTALSIF